VTAIPWCPLDRLFVEVSHHDQFHIDARSVPGPTVRTRIGERGLSGHVSTTPDDRRKAGVEFTHEGGGEPIADEDAFLEEIGIDPDEIDEDPSLPPCLE
jgi:hypothetical protein